VKGKADRFEVFRLSYGMLKYRTVETHFFLRGHPMCESSAYLIKDGKEELLMESVDFLKPQGDRILLKSIFGEQTIVEARLREMDLTGHRIVLESP
jgi:predicted RNA-binding protein